MNKSSPTSCWTGVSPNISSGSQSLDIQDPTSSRRYLRTRMDSTTPPPRSDLTSPRRNLRTRMDPNPLPRSPQPLSRETKTPSDQRQLRFAINTSAFLAQRIRKKVHVVDSRHRINNKAASLDIFSIDMKENVKRKIAATLNEQTEEDNRTVGRAQRFHNAVQGLYRTGTGGSAYQAKGRSAYQAKGNINTMSLDRKTSDAFSRILGIFGDSYLEGQIVTLSR
jgi:hypothetical protein